MGDGLHDSESRRSDGATKEPLGHVIIMAELGPCLLGRPPQRRHRTGYLRNSDRRQTLRMNSLEMQKKCFHKCRRISQAFTPAALRDVLKCFETFRDTENKRKNLQFLPTYEHSNCCKRFLPVALHYQVANEEKHDDGPVGAAHVGRTH